MFLPFVASLAWAPLDGRMEPAADACGRFGKAGKRALDKVDAVGGRVWFAG